MITQRQVFLENLAQTSHFPQMINVASAEGNYIYDTAGKKYFDLIAGISVSQLGHRHPKVIEAIKKQLDEYLHVMVYGEFVQTPQLKMAQLLSQHLPKELSCTYFVNSGSEAAEGAFKLAKRYTGRREVIAFNNAYHGSTHGALTLCGNEDLKASFRPLVPGVRHFDIHDEKAIAAISQDTAAVIIEPIQGEAGARPVDHAFLKQLSEACKANGTLLIFDEIQCGFGRTGSLFAFQEIGVKPDILLLGKAMGGGMPIGAFVSSYEIMDTLKSNPVLGHISTFGGHPIACTAAHAGFEALLESKLIEQVPKKEALFRKLLNNRKIKQISGKGLLLAMHLNSFQEVQDVMTLCTQKGIITDWFLFNNHAIRIAPPLTITFDEIEMICRELNNFVDIVVNP